MHVISDSYRDPHPMVLVRVLGRLAEGDVAGARELIHREWQSHGSPWTKELHASPASAAVRLAAFQRAEGLPACSDCGCTEPPVLFLQDTTGLLDDRDDLIDGVAPSWHGTPEVSADLTCVGCGSGSGTCPGGNAAEAVDSVRRLWTAYHTDTAEEDGGGRDV